MGDEWEYEPEPGKKITYRIEKFFTHGFGPGAVVTTTGQEGKLTLTSRSVYVRGMGEVERVVTIGTEKSAKTILESRRIAGEEK